MSHYPSKYRADILEAIYSLIAALYQAPREPLLEDLETKRLDTLVKQVAMAMKLEPPAFASASFETLQIQYVALFISNRASIPAPPYATYALDNEILGSSWEDLRIFFKRYGLAFNESWQDLPDHIAVLAEAGLLLMQKGFLDAAYELNARFLTPWFNRFAEPISKADKSHFYGPLSVFLGSCLSEVSYELSS